jgi:hypothetical protein
MTAMAATPQAQGPAQGARCLQALTRGLLLGFGVHGALSTAQPLVACGGNAPIRLAHSADLERPGQLGHVQAEAEVHVVPGFRVDVGGFGDLPARMRLIADMASSSVSKFWPRVTPRPVLLKGQGPPAGASGASAAGNDSRMCACAQGQRLSVPVPAVAQQLGFGDEVHRHALDQRIFHHGRQVKA